MHIYVLSSILLAKPLYNTANKCHLDDTANKRHLDDTEVDITVHLDLTQDVGSVGYNANTWIVADTFHVLWGVKRIKYCLESVIYEPVTASIIKKAEFQTYSLFGIDIENVYPTRIP